MNKVDILKINDNVEMRNIALDFAREGDDNNAIMCLLRAIELGNPYACIDMCFCINYTRINYQYSEEALEAIHPVKFSYYIEKGISMGSLDCKFYKAREQFTGDGFIELDAQAAYNNFLELKELNYDPWDYFEDDWTVDDYIEMLKKDLNL
jgi:hypothetical protein